MIAAAAAETLDVHLHQQTKMSSVTAWECFKARITTELAYTDANQFKAFSADTDVLRILQPCPFFMGLELWMDWCLHQQSHNIRQLYCS